MWSSLNKTFISVEKQTSSCKLYPRVKITKIQQVFKLNQNQSSLEQRNRIVDSGGKAINSIIVTDQIELDSDGQKYL